MLVDENKASLISSFCSSTRSRTFHYCYLCLYRLVENVLAFLRRGRQPEVSYFPFLSFPLLFSFLTCLYTTTFTLPSIFAPLEKIRMKIWETLSWHTKCSLPVAVRVSKTRVLSSLIGSLRNEDDDGYDDFI